MDSLAGIDGVAGLAALVNGLILWPLYYLLKKDHGARLERLEQAADRPKRRRGRVP